MLKIPKLTKKPRLPCAVHGYHWPPVKAVDEHHVWPLGLGGPDVKINLVWVCPTGHRNIHAAFTLLMKGLKPIGTKKEIHFATSGHAQWLANGKPKPVALQVIPETLEYAIKVREAVPGMPAEGPYPASTDEVADEVVDFIKQMDQAKFTVNLTGHILEKLWEPTPGD